MELLVLSNPNISTIITWAFGVASGANHESICNNTTSCILNSNVWTEPRGISGLVLIVIALILAFAVILIKELHTKSTRNAIIMFITIAFPILSAICWYEAMLIVIALTLFYLMKKIEQEDYSVVYMTFI
ncbi:unnamed protein product, partial [Schistosoma turkestanicum]